MADKYPYNVEAPQELIYQWSQDIVFDYSSGQFPSGNEIEFLWENYYMPLPHYKGDILLESHVWKRYKVGKSGVWSLPIRVNDLTKDITINSKGIIEGKETYSLIFNQESGINIESNDFYMPTFEGEAWLESYLNSYISGINPIKVTNGVISHSNSVGHKHVPSGGLASQVLTTDGADNYSWETDVPFDGYTKTELNTSGAGGQVHWDNVTSKDTVYYDATIGGATADYPANDVTDGLKAALDAGYYNLKVIADFTVHADLGVHSKDIVLDADELKIVTFTVANTADLKLNIRGISLQGLSVTRFTANSSLLILNTAFTEGFTVFNNNVTISKCKLSAGTITIDPLAENTIIENCTTVTPIIKAGINTRLINNYATDGNPSTNALQEKLEITGKTSGGVGDLLNLKDVNGNSILAVDDIGTITFSEEGYISYDAAGNDMIIYASSDITIMPAGSVRIAGTKSTNTYLAPFSDNVVSLGHIGRHWTNLHLSGDATIFNAIGTASNLTISAGNTRDDGAANTAAIILNFPKDVSDGTSVVTRDYVNTNYLVLTQNANILTIGAGGQVALGSHQPTEKLDVGGNITVTGTYKVNGVQVVTTQQPVIADATGAATGTDAVMINELKTQLNSALAMLRTHGLITT